MSTLEALKAKAIDLFGESLGAVIATEIDEGIKKEKQGSTMKVLSWKTGFASDAFYSKVQNGRFSGRLSVTWDGMDEFVFLPDPASPLTFVRHDGAEIIPRKMYTDGGSIPRLLRGAKKYSSWGYAPAFIVHDWLFTAKKCKHSTDVDWQFPETAWVMAEAIKTLMEVGYINFKGEVKKIEKSEDTLFLMFLAVSSPIAKRLWDDDTSVTCVL